MKKIACIFAHPDDEALGPGGTLAHLAKNNEVYILCVTGGEAGGEASIRKEELLQSAKILGVKEVRFVGFKDGDLCNNSYHKIADKLKTHLDELKPQVLLTFEMRGISGHIDHITVSMISSYLFEKLAYVKKIMYYCITDRMRNLIDEYFIYFPPGFKADEVDEVYKLDEVWDKKVAAMCCHKSQQEDVDFVLDIYKKVPKEEHFITRSK